MAVEMFLNNPQDVEQMCPPMAVIEEPEQKKVKQDASFDTWKPSKGTMVSCGHVECNMESSDLIAMMEFLTSIITGVLPHSKDDGEYLEFAGDKFTILVAKKQLKAFE